MQIYIKRYFAVSNWDSKIIMDNQTFTESNHVSVTDQVRQEPTYIFNLSSETLTFYFYVTAFIIRLFSGSVFV